MAINQLQDKIRKMKNPSVVNLSIFPELIPNEIIMQTASFVEAREQYCMSLLDALKEIVPAVRFSFSSFALGGEAGTLSLKRILSAADDFGYYVLLDGVEALSAQEATFYAETLMSDDCPLKFDGLILSNYIGSDSIKPYLPYMKDNGKDLFVVARTSNRSAGELQDLLSGSRWMHMANVDVVNRFTQQLMTRCAYSQVAVVAAASNAESLRILREKYKEIFLLLDGCDYPNANAKNCSFAFDVLGHGAAACAGESIVAAWKTAEEGVSHLQAAVDAATRLKRNLLRYVTVV